ncbi:UDP-N-acetylmuramoyl-tripeptide--D-alanyl-D-alanine ligase [Mesorhizobium loti R88b]|uniref:UDP-N-acetylmuramoyl-tripeptide--D-alanyl-D-alanine ligase n=2 Tax=Rhizobium loti TaxID=381 RepID=A0A6M7WVS8_RHILI|nr:UDP-N-acetylmuramoyl-tripeptide--D-alanyl-D-alanine ligase [Mesorhizobium loti R88b]
MQVLSFDKQGKTRTFFRAIKKCFHVELARRRRHRSRATVIGITGSSAKTTTSELLAFILEPEGRVHKQTKGNTFKPLVRGLRRLSRDADYAVIEVAAGGKSGVAAMAALLKPDIAVVTLVADEHRSIFRGAEAVAIEKQWLVQSLPLAGVAMLNADDPRVMAMAKASMARTVTFGRGDTADYRATDIKAAFPSRLALQLRWQGGAVVLRTRFVAEHFWLPVAAAAATALELGIDPDHVSERIACFEPLFDRFSVLEVPGGPAFLIDTNKAPLHSLNLAFDALKKADVPHKRAIVGQISDYVGKADKTYRAVYQNARAAADEVIFVGENAHRARASDQDRDSGRFHEMRSVRKAADHIKATLRPNELILIKGSGNLHLERIALALTQDVQCWQDQCGQVKNCISCGKYGIPFERHAEVRKAEKRAQRWWRRLLGMKGSPNVHKREAGG